MRNLLRTCAECAKMRVVNSNLGLEGRRPSMLYLGKEEDKRMGVEGESLGALCNLLSFRTSKLLILIRMNEWVTNR